MKTAEEILEPKLFNWYKVQAVTKSEAIKAMEEYANQFRGENKEKWVGGSITCDFCGHQWVAVREDKCVRLECPNCRNMTFVFYR